MSHRMDIAGKDITKFVQSLMSDREPTVSHSRRHSAAVYTAVRAPPLLCLLCPRALPALRLAVNPPRKCFQIPVEVRAQTAVAVKETLCYTCPDMVKEYAKYDKDPGPSDRPCPCTRRRIRRRRRIRIRRRRRRRCCRRRRPLPPPPPCGPVTSAGGGRP